MNDFLTILSKKEVKEFIKKNIDTDPKKLILNPPKEFDNNMIKVIADQILSRKKAKGKLCDWIDNLDLIFPPPLSIEQASSQSTSAYKGKIIKGGHLIDLTGGMGIDCIALSNEFVHTTYVEKQDILYEIFKHNVAVLKKDIEVKNELAEDVLKSLPKVGKSTIIYIDPARRDDSKNKVFKLEDCTPNLKELMPMLRLKSSQVLVKLSPLVDIKSILNEFENVKEIHVVSVKNDCKELLILIDFSFEQEATIKAINLESEQPIYSFISSEEEKCSSQFGEFSSFILEPNTSILKAGAFKKIGMDFNLKKLSRHTHLYSSDKEINHFPGRTFKKVADADKKTIRTYAPDGKINVLTRNYPIKPDAIKKKWKLKDGGKHFLIGFRNTAEKACLVIAERVS